METANGFFTAKSFIFTNIFRILNLIIVHASYSLAKLGLIVLRASNIVITSLESIVGTLNYLYAGHLNGTQALVILGYDLNIIVTDLAGFSAVVAQAILVASGSIANALGGVLLQVTTIAGWVVTAVNTVAKGIASAAPSTSISSIVNEALNTMTAHLQSGGVTLTTNRGPALLNAVNYCASVITSVVASNVGVTAQLIAYSSTNVNLAITYCNNAIQASGA